jgi:oligopeptide/dipeptide ABC transporter ATP-binding protein
VNKPLLEVRNLQTHFHTEQGVVRAVDGVSFDVPAGSVLGIVGESGCGKSVTALSILRLIAPPGRIMGGQVLLHTNGRARDLLTLPPAEMDRVRGVEISMIFQDPMTSLNPVLSIGYQLAEPLRIHHGLSPTAARERAAALLDRVGIPDARRRLGAFPHEFSGGMRQRVMIAMALACGPQLLLADEPTTALDVTIQSQILDLLLELKDEFGTAILIITHDLGVIAEIADRVVVMYAGMIAESAPVAEVFAAPQHPYTRALVASIPRLGHWPDRLTTIEGAPPSLADEISGCPFAPRCPYRIARCVAERPALLELAPGHASACWVAQAGGLDVG